MFTVIKGHGWVRAGDGDRRRVSVGEAAFWTAGELHESGSDIGMTVLIVQSPVADGGNRFGDLLAEASDSGP